MRVSYGCAAARIFRHGLPEVALHRVLQLGAGAAVAYTALTIGVERFVLFDVDVERARRLTSELVERFGESKAVAVVDIGTEIFEADGLIHATPTEMGNHPGLPLPASLLRPELWVAEIVYFPLETELLR